MGRIKYLLIFIASLLVGCVFHDPAYKQQKETRLPINLINGIYSNDRAYGTSSYGLKKLSWLIKNYDLDATDVEIEYKENKGVTFRFKKGNQILDTADLRFGEDLEKGKNKEIWFNPERGVPFCDCPAIYFENKKYSMYINSEKRLVVVEHAFTAGVFIIVPAAYSEKKINVFNRINY